MAILKERTKKGKYRFKVRVRAADGNWLPQVTCDTKADAKRIEAQLQEQQAAAILKASFLRQSKKSNYHPTSAVMPTVAQYWEAWSKECRGKTSLGWQKTQNLMYRIYIEPEIGTLQIGHISPRDIGNLLTSAQAKKNLKPQSVLHIYQLLHKMFDDAVEYFEITDFNPVIKRLRPELKQVERPFLTPAQSWKLLNHVRDHWIGPPVWLMTLAGLRIGETQALRWSSVNFVDGFISIRASFDHKMQRINDYPKQGDWGRAPMPAALSEYLKGRSVGRSPDDLVCPGRDGGFHWRNRFGAALTKACKGADVPRMTAHELRHSCTELYIEAGASAEDIRRLLNQSSLTATARYIHRTDERLSKIASEIRKS